MFSVYPGETPVIEGTGVTAGNTGFAISHSYIKLIGLAMRNWETGLWMENVGYVELSDCEVYEVEYGIGIADGSHDFVLNRCKTYDVFDGFDISAYNTTLNRCIAYDCWNGTYKLWRDDVMLVNCVGYNSGSANVELDWDGQPGSATLMNCTFFNAKTFTIWIENTVDTLRMCNFRR